MATLARGNSSIGLSNIFRQDAYLPVPDEVDSSDEIIATLTARLQNLETIVEGKANANAIRTLIAFSDEAILIKAKDIVLAGTVTIVDVINEQNGTTSGEVPISITQIIGDMVRTGSLVSNNWAAGEGSFISLDDGVIIMGGSASPSFLFDGTNLFVGGTITAAAFINGGASINGTAASTVVTNAASGKSLSDSLLISGAAILKGVIQPTDSGAIATGSITWNPVTGSLTGGTGVAMTEWGIIGASGGSATFTLNASTGEAIFSGALSAATGTFAGNLVTSGQVYATGATTTAFGSAAVVGYAASIGINGLIGYSVLNIGVRGESGSASGVYGICTGAAGTGVFATNTGGGNAITVGSGPSVLQAVSATTGTFSSALSATTGTFSGAIGATNGTFSGTVTMTSGSANLVIGNASNTGNANICIKVGAAGANTAGQILVYGAAASTGDSTLGIVTYQGVEVGTGALSGTGINQLRVRVNGTEYGLALNPI